ncbi:MAG: epimerase, partial [Gemmatimonadota bacterium]
PGDPTDRFTYWPVRLARGGEILAPGDGSDPVQVIDARDLAEWIIRTTEEGVTGTYNATGPRARLTMAGELHGIRAALPGDIDLRFTWVPAGFLADHDVSPWMEMTTWFGPGSALSRTSVDLAVAAGLTYRPLAATAADALEWFRTLPNERRSELQAGLDPEKERRVLASWRAAEES